jgi:hypothetical protein
MGCTEAADPFQKRSLKMPLEIHPNDNAREAKPGIWIFQGRSAALLVLGAAIFIALFRVLMTLDIDWPEALLISLAPLGAMTVSVHLLVNGRSPSYASDLALLGIWRFQVRLYMAGALDRPPELWVRNSKPMHPTL